MSRRALASLSLLLLLAAGCSPAPGGMPTVSGAAGEPSARATADPFPDVGLNPRSEYGFPDYPEIEPTLEPATRVLSAAEASTLTQWKMTNSDTCLVDGAGRPPCLYEFTFASLPPGVVVGSVLASDVTQAAPTGLLAVVTDLNGNSGQAREASLPDALVNGAVFAAVEFDAAKARGAGEARRGVGRTFAAATPTGPDVAVPLSKTLHQGFGYELHVDEDGVKVDGAVSFGVGCEFGIGVVKKYKVIPAGVWFDAGCGVQQSGSLDVTVDEDVPSGDPIPIDTIELGTLTFWVGPLPVVLDFELGVSVDPTGQLLAHVSYGASESVKLGAAIHYRSGKGWWTSDQKDTQSEWHATGVNQPAVVGTDLRSDFRVMLYGIAGPYIGIGFGPQVEAAWGKKPAECLYLHAALGVGAHLDLGMFGEYDWGPQDIFSDRFKIDCHPNFPPTVTFTSPTDGASVTQGAVFATELKATASDREDGTLAVSFTDSVDGPITAAQPGQAPLWVPKTVGVHVLTATATDSDGASGSAAIKVTVGPPTWTVSVELADAPGAEPPAEIAATQGQTVLLRARPAASANQLAPTCSALTWTTKLPTGAIPKANQTSATIEDLGDCAARVTLTNQGTVRVTASLSAPGGAHPSDYVVFRVGAPAASRVPVIAGISAKTPTQVLYSGDTFSGGAVELTVRWTNPDARMASYTWTIRTDGGVAQPLGRATKDGATSTRSYSVSGNSDHTYLFGCTVALSDGTTIQKEFTLKYLAPPR